MELCSYSPAEEEGTLMAKIRETQKKIGGMTSNSVRSKKESAEPGTEKKHSQGEARGKSN